MFAAQYNSERRVYGVTCTSVNIFLIGTRTRPLKSWNIYLLFEQNQKGVVKKIGEIHLVSGGTGSVEY